MQTDGTPTGGEKPGEPTQGDEQAAAAEKEPKFTDDDMAAMRASMDKRFTKRLAKERAAWERESLDALDVDSFDDVRELLSGKRQEQSDLERQLGELKSKHREAARQLDDYAELKAKHDALVGRVHEAAKRDAVFELAKAANAHEDFVYLKVKSQLGVDESGDVFVMDSDGEPAGTSLETVIKKLVAEDQRLLRAVDGAGAGSGPPTGAPTGRSGSPMDWQAKIRQVAATATGATFAQSVTNPFATK